MNGDDDGSEDRGGRRDGARDAAATGGGGDAADAGDAGDGGGGPSADEPRESADGRQAAAVGAADLPPVEELTGDVRRLHPRVRLAWVLRWGAVALVVGAVAGGAGAVLGPVFWPGPVLFTVAFALGVAHAVAHYRVWRYEVRADALYLDRGVVTRVRTVVPHVRIQHVDVSRGPVERALGLSSVVVYTAGSRGADVTVPGLPPARADDLQSRLKGLAIAAEGEDAV